MGLDLFAEGLEGQRFGSYSGVQAFRQMVCRLAAELAEHPMERSMLTGVASDPEREVPDYESVPSRDWWYQYSATTQGILMLVDHSDCDGGHPVHEVNMIASALEGILSHVRDDVAKVDREWIETIAAFFRKAADAGVVVEYG